MTESSVRWTSTERNDVSVTFSQLSRPSGDAVLDLRVDVKGRDLDAGVWVRTVEGDGLGAFLADLAVDFPGWPGLRRWQSLDGLLSIQAEHAGWRVRLRVEIAGDDHDDAWRITVPLAIAPGEELSTLAHDMSALLARGG